MPASTFRRRLLLAGTAALALSGCGFRLRGPQLMAFETIHIVGLDPHSAIGSDLRRQIQANGITRVLSSRDEAEVVLEVLRDQREREILSLSGGGSVREYEIERVLLFRVIRPDGSQVLGPTLLRARREYDFDDTQVIAKQREEQLLYTDMEADLVQQLVRRLAAIQP